MPIAQEWEQREREQRRHRGSQPTGYTRTHAQNGSSEQSHERLANGLGWFSIGLGLAEVVAPSQLARMIGVRNQDSVHNLLRVYGLREIASGVGILSQRRPAGWMWSRVAGDLLDLATLGSALKADDSGRGRLTAATTAVLGVTVLDLYCAQQLSRGQGRARDSVLHRRNSILVNSSPEEVYEFWRDFENLPRFMSNLESVRMLDDRRSHWKAKGPAGMNVEWDAEMLEDRPNELIAWRSLEGADIENSGTVRFERAPGGRGTIVRVELRYAPPGGSMGANIAKLFSSEPGQEVQQDLRAFKQMIEVGEVVNSDASIHRGMHPAQPPAQGEFSLSGRENQI